MGIWPWKGTSKRSESEQVSDSQPEAEAFKSIDPLPTSYSRGQKILLEDTRPRFNNEMSQSQRANSQENISFKEAWDTISWGDFSVARLVSIPCFRESGLLGFSSMFVMGSIMFIYHKNPSRAINWSLGGLLLGSIVGWEQCRMRRKRSFQIAQMGKQTMANKERPTSSDLDEAPTIIHPNNNDKSGKTPWYKFW